MGIVCSKVSRYKQCWHPVHMYSLLVVWSCVYEFTINVDSACVSDRMFVSQVTHNVYLKSRI